MRGRVDKPERRSICDGAKVRVFAAVLKDGRCPAIEFLNDLRVPDKAKLFTLFKRYADFAVIQDGTKFKRLDGDIFEFKARGRDTGLRVTCYRSADGLVLLTGFTKKEDEADPREIALAKRVMEEDQALHR